MAPHPLNGLALCAGGGGLELALHIAEPAYRTVGYVEREAYAAASLVARMAAQELDQAPVWDDLATFDGRAWRGLVDIVSAGYPCQPFSAAGKRRGVDDPRHLWPHVARIVAECEPGAVFLENVPNHLRLGFREVYEDLGRLGYKNHISTDRRHGFIRRWAVSSAAEHDSRRFREVVDTGNTGSDVWADTAYRSRKNEEFMAKRGLRSKVHFRRAPGKPLSQAHAKANAARSKVRSAVEHVFATQKGPMALFVRTIGIARATTKIGMANLVYNMRRLVWWDGRTAPA